jgi:3-keto-disaccharide hydrolase
MMISEKLAEVNSPSGIDAASERAKIAASAFRPECSDPSLRRGRIMRKLLSALLLLLYAFVVSAQDKPKTDKKPIETFIEPGKAGPDFTFQGEYAGEGPGQQKFGAQVIADGDGAFTIKGMLGGLPGDGWDGTADKVKMFKGKLEDGKVTFGDDEGKAVIADGKITVKGGDNSFELKKVTRKSSTEGMKPPEGAIVMFDGKDLSQWTKMDEKTPASWVVEGGYMQVKGGDIVSKAKFAGPHTIHVEFFLPFMPRARGQGRANSGVYIQNRYEVQVLDSFGLKGLDNEAGAIYSQTAPKVNMCYPPLQWQTYDIDFTPAKFADGKKSANARVTVKHNGVAVLEDVEIKGPTGGGKPEDETGQGIRLQDHGNPMRFRNIWAVEKKVTR